MAMIMPIMVGLQMAIAAGQSEQAEIALQADGGPVLAQWKDRQERLQKELDRWKENSEFSNAPVSSCQGPYSDFKKSSDGECAFEAPTNVDPKYMVRFSPADRAWRPCLVVSGSGEKCPWELGA